MDRDLEAAVEVGIVAALLLGALLLVGAPVARIIIGDARGWRWLTGALGLISLLTLIPNWPWLGIPAALGAAVTGLLAVRHERRREPDRAGR